jgi:hypothetical protein
LSLAIAPEFQGQCGNAARIGVVLFSERRRNHRGPSQVSKEVEGVTAMFLVTKDDRHRSGQSSEDFLPQTMRNLPAIMQVNRLARKNKFLTKSNLPVKTSSTAF